MGSRLHLRHHLVIPQHISFDAQQFRQQQQQIGREEQTNEDSDRRRREKKNNVKFLDS